MPYMLLEAFSFDFMPFSDCGVNINLKTNSVDLYCCGNHLQQPQQVFFSAYSLLESDISKKYPVELSGGISW